MKHQYLSHDFELQHHSDEPFSIASTPTAELMLAGRKMRKKSPRQNLATLAPRTRDPLVILQEQNSTRIADLIPLRHERMSQSPFTFYRGTAAIMAADLAEDPHTGLLVASCGDAHLSNFGFYASPQRSLVFDLNDFDEAAWAPWEWDLKRLATSVILAAQSTNRDAQVAEQAVLETVLHYARALRASVSLSPVQRYYAHFDAEAGLTSLPSTSQKVLRKAIKQAKKRTGDRAVKKLTVLNENGVASFVQHPPEMTEMDQARKRQLHQLMQSYLESARPDIQQLLRHYRMQDVVRRVVGVGSVGTRCALVLLQDGEGHALLMQSKQASTSVLEQYGNIKQPRALTELVDAHGQGARVVAMQQILQAVSDPFLGHLKFDGLELYVRQFHDMKGGIETDELDDESFLVYARACAVTLARAHSQSPLTALISGYIGKGNAVAEALLEWGYNYAERANDDFATFVGEPSPAT